jgi:hypothetical protein
MSVPLDRLYDFIETGIQRNAIIYRWIPHGSKKITDLGVLGWENNANWHINLFQKPAVICHDQEFLNPDLHSVTAFLDAFQQQSTAGNDPMHFNYEYIKLKAQLRFQSWCPSKYPLIILHSELNSPALDYYQKHMNMIGSYYWAHAIIALDWYRYAKVDFRLSRSMDYYEKDFLIYNRAWSGSREYRLKFLELLIEQGLLQYSDIKFNAWDNDIHYTNHCFKNKDLQISTTNYEDLVKPNNHQSDASAQIDFADYQKCAIEVVLETLFDDQRWHLTEKILRPIACGKPFLLVSTPGSLKYLKSYGFKTFGDIIDESYDDISDPLERLQAVVLCMKELSLQHIDTKQRVWRQINDISQYNRQRFFSENFFQTVCKELFDNLEQALEDSVHRPDPYYLKYLLQSYEKTHTPAHRAWNNIYIDAMRRCSL